MRDIKFRAWDSRTKELIPILGFKYVGKKHIQLFYLDEEGDSTTCTCEKEFIELMEDTGINDKNGKEICVHDIIKFGNQVGAIGQLQNGCYTFIRNEEYFKCDPLPLYVMSFKYVEVIGNIYENPELLERGA